MYQGFLFDLDGTLVDSLAVVEQAWREWGARHHIANADILAFIHGKQAITSIRHFLPTASEAVIQAEFDWLECYESRALKGVVALPGARQLLTDLSARHIPWGVVTSGSLPVASRRYERLALPVPQVFITAEQVSRGKPYPDPYLLGAKQLGLVPEKCVVVEDAVAGIQSGLSAGCGVVAVNAAAALTGVMFCLTDLRRLTVSQLDDNHFILTKDAVAQC